VSIHHSHSYGPSPTYTPHSTSIEPSQVLGYDGKSESSSRCGVEASPPSNPLPSPPYEAQVPVLPTTYQPFISPASTARIFTFVSMPCPSRASYARSIPSLPSSSHDVALPSSSSYPIGGSSIVDVPPCSDDPGKSAVVSLPPDFALGAAYYIV
jgi:hypothetical protein